MDTPNEPTPAPSPSDTPGSSPSTSRPLDVTPRLLASLAAGAVLAAFAALFLGEYEFDLTLSLVSGVLLGLVVAEVVVSISRQQHPVIAGFCAAFSATAIVLAGAIDANNVEPIKNMVWVGALIAALTAGWRSMPSRRATKATT